MQTPFQVLAHGSYKSHPQKMGRFPHSENKHVIIKVYKTDARRNTTLSGTLGAGGLARIVGCPLNYWA